MLSATLLRRLSPTFVLPLLQVCFLFRTYGVVVAFRLQLSFFFFNQGKRPFVGETFFFFSPAFFSFFFYFQGLSYLLLLGLFFLLKIRHPFFWDSFGVTRSPQVK